jgi:cytoskeleton protein RodZ
MSKITQMPVDNDGNGGANRRRIHLREISGDSETPAETVGQELRAARLRRGDEIAQVSRALKIRKDHLEALENDKLEDLPGKTYAIGFVRSYARHLGLDAADFVERFKRDIAGRAEDNVREPAAIHQDDRRLSYGWRLIAGAVIILLGWGGWHLLSSNNAANQPVPPAPILNPPKPTPLPAPKPVMVPPQAATPSPAADGVPPAASGDASQQQASALPPPAAGAQSPATRTTPLSSNSPTVAPQTSAAQPSAAPASGHAYGLMNHSPRVIVRMRNDAHVVVRGPQGQLLLNRDLKAGDSYQVPNVPGMTMSTDNAAAAEVNLDGSSLGVTGAPNEGLPSLSLDPQALADRFNKR